MKFFTIEDDFVKVDLDPTMYRLESAYAVAYQMLEDAYIYFKGDAQKNIEVYISHIDDTKNSEKNLALLGKKFLNHLINHINYTINSKEKELTRALLLKKSFDNVNLINYNMEHPESALKCECEEDVQKDQKQNEIVFEDPDKDFCGTNQTEDKTRNDNTTSTKKEDDTFTFDDPEGIAIPWEEKYNA